MYRDISLRSEKIIVCQKISLCSVKDHFIKKEWALVKKKSTLLIIKSVICFGVFHTKVFDLI